MAPSSIAAVAAAAAEVGQDWGCGLALSKEWSEWRRRGWRFLVNPTEYARLVLAMANGARCKRVYE